ncbi:MAG: amidohydrolase family protein [Balneolaceae bacterium]
MKQQREIIFRHSLLLLFLAFSINIYAQSDPTGQAPPTRTYAITNATIIQAPGKVIENGTLLISNGMIINVGTSVSIPDNAQEIDGTDLFIYPGFIDGMSYTGAKRPEAIQRPNNLFTPNPPNDYAGITPEQSVIDQIDVTDNSIENLRQLGFTVSHSVPYGRMLPGSGSIILLSEADHTDHLILKENYSMYTQFEGAPGAYPGNTLGIMAKWRNLFTNASYQRVYAQAYSKDPVGLNRPTQDRVVEAFYPIVAKEKSVFYNASSLLEAQRAIRLKKELNFNLTIGNLEEGWYLIDQIKETNTSVFMSLNLPDKPKNSDEDDKSEEIIELEKKRMDAYNRHLIQFREMKSQGVTFGFSTMGATSSKIKNNLLSIIEAGLSEDDALSALTIDAALLLGIESITGTLDVGKIGNAVVSTGPYFNKDSNVKMVFIDGNKYDLDTKESRTANGVSAEDEAVLIGSWSYSSNTPQGEQTGKMIIQKNDDVLSGIMSGNNGAPDSDMNNISFVNGNLSFDYAVEFGGQTLEIVIEGDILGTDFDGVASISQFNASWAITATKDNPDQN